jgi:hypothetical protein
VLILFSKKSDTNTVCLNISMTAQQFIEQGNNHRSAQQPEQALGCYIRAIESQHDNPDAWNNYGNVLREMGYPERAIPMLGQANLLAPNNPTIQFNLAVAHLLAGDYESGWRYYESRRNYEHLKGSFPQWPRLWQGENIKDKTLLVWGEQGLGDNIQFLRFALQLREQGTKIRMQVPGMVVPLLGGDAIDHVSSLGSDPPEYDYWIPIMSLPKMLGVTLKNLVAPNRYVLPNAALCSQWRQRLGLKHRLRVGFSWSGRRDSWINQHKSVPLSEMLSLIKQFPDVEWINLQVDCNTEEEQLLIASGVRTFPGSIQDLGDTAALISQLDLVISVDTAVSHLAGALGSATWIMLNQYAQDWRWLLKRLDSPWYPSVRLFRQSRLDNWQSVTDEIAQNLRLFKI